LIDCFLVVAATRRTTALASLLLQNNLMVTLSASLKANEENTHPASKLHYVSSSRTHFISSAITHEL